LWGSFLIWNKNWNPQKGETEKMERQHLHVAPDAWHLPLRQSTMAYCLLLLLFIILYILLWLWTHIAFLFMINAVIWRVLHIVNVSCLMCEPKGFLRGTAYIRTVTCT
jgi:hypothetical protein